jgi:DNA-binding sugar fermentation-stimulating protein
MLLRFPSPLIGGRLIRRYKRFLAEAFALARDIDPAYARAFDAAIRQGVEAIALACALSVDGLLPPRRIPLLDPALESQGGGAVAPRHVSP